jgi:DNA-directed RNA polymerase specialized sigma24 family protein
MTILLSEPDQDFAGGEFVLTEHAWSETFLAALSAYPRLRANSNIEAWLVTIAHRKALDHLRAASRRLVVIDEVPERPVKDGSREGWESGLWERSRRCHSNSGRRLATTTPGGDALS